MRFRQKISTAASLLLITFVIALVASQAAYAAVPCTIYGTVTDSNGNAIGGATVSCGSITSQTSGSGYYQLSGNSFEIGSSYTVTASKSGYNSASGSISIHNGSDAEKCDLSMSIVPPATPTPTPTATPTPTPAPNNNPGAPASYSIGMISVTEAPNVTATPEPTVVITPVPATATPIIEPAVTPTPVPTTTAQTSPDLTWLLFLLLLLIAFILGYLIGRKHEQMKQDEKNKK